MATIEKTNQSDVIANFVRYYGRQPKDSDMATINYLTTKAPKEVESLLAKNSPVTGGKLWADYNKTQSPTVSTSQPTKTTTTTPPKMATLYGPSGQTQPVPVGSELASALQTNGWGLTAGSYKEPTKTDTAPKTEKTQAQIDEENRLAAEKAQSDKINEYIDGLGLDDNQKQILKYVAKGTYNTGNKVYTPSEIDKLINDAATNAQTDLDPYYQNQETQSIQDLQNKFADIRNQSARYNQQEQKSYKQTLEEAKSKLRASGLTFSGRNIKTLGAESAINNGGIEGDVPQQRRYDIEDANAVFQQNARTAGLDAERKLGSAKLNDVQGSLGTIANPYGSGTAYNPSLTRNLYEVSQAGTPGYVANGTNTLDRLKAIEESKWNRIGSLTSPIK